VKSLVYLASPYSHPEPSVREERFQEVCRAAAHLMFSPIAHTHPISLVGSLPGEWEYWKSYDEAVLSTCRSLVVLQLENWEQSKGIQGEVEIAGRIDLPTYYTSPSPDDLDQVTRLLTPAKPDERSVKHLDFARKVSGLYEPIKS
jgi:hypothetical protein